MIEIIQADGQAERRHIAAMRARAAQVGADIQRAVSAVMQNVQERGFDAVREYSLQFDRREPYELSQADLEAAYDRCPRALTAAMEHAAANIRDYNEKLLVKSQEWTSPDGGTVGRVVRGLSRVGIYVPGGTAAYPSSVLMNAVPAKVAGVGEIIMVTPPTENLNDAVLAAAKIAGVDRVIAVGGAQAVAALAYGAGFIPRVDKLVGPGNAYVAAAKRMAYGQVDIDMVAGPSEVLVIADEKADPRLAAADLLSQAEHDKLASAVLLTNSLALAEAPGLRLRHRVRYSGGLRGPGQRDRPGEPGDRDRGAQGPAVPDQKRRGGVPGGLVAGAPGGLPGRARPRAAHQRHCPVLLPPQRGQFPQNHEYHPV